MDHDQEAIVKAFREAVAKLAPLTPKEITEEAYRLADDLEHHPGTTSEQIRQALVYIGKKEYPYRKAYIELCAGDEEERLQASVLRKLPDTIMAKISPVIQHGVHILDFVQTSQFDALSEHEKVAIDNAIREAHDEVDRQCDERAHERAQTYESLVARWTLVREQVEARIEALRAMADRDPTWTDDILAKVRQYEDGFSVLAEDPSPQEIEQEMAHWGDVLERGEDVDGEVE